VFCHAKVRLNTISRIQPMYRDIRNQRGVEYVRNKQACRVGLSPDVSENTAPTSKR
jgi:hypothetical protein